MKKIVQLFVMLMLTTIVAYGQNSITTNKKAYITERDPFYPGGQHAMRAFIKENLKYPRSAKKNKTTGRVFVNFIINKDGDVINAKVMRGIGDGCDEEALRVVNSMPQWEPAFQNGKPINVSITVPISFYKKRFKRR